MSNSFLVLRVVPFRNWIVISFFCGLLMCNRPAPAQELEIQAVRAQESILQVSFSPKPPAHLSEGFSVSLPDGTVLRPLEKPVPDADGAFPSFSKPFSLQYPLRKNTAMPDFVKVAWQMCEGELCYLPQTTVVPVRWEDKPVTAPPQIGSDLAVGRSPAPPRPAEISPLERFSVASVWDGHATPSQFCAFLGRPSGPVASTGWRSFLENPNRFLLRYGWGLTLLAILAGGFLLNLTPCVLPMIPVNLAIIGASVSSGASRGVRFGLGVAYGAGMAAVYGTLGAMVVRAGGVFGASLNASPFFAAAMAILFGALGLAMFGAWNLDFSRWRRAGRLAGKARFPAAFVAGGLSALLAGACVAPVLVAVLALAGSLYSAGQSRALALPFLLGVGMALPWPLAAAGIAILPKPGRWMEVVKKVFGTFILLLAVWYAWNAVGRLVSAPNDGKRDGSNDTAHLDETAAPPGFVRIDFAEEHALERLEGILADAADAHSPVLLDFGARWCKVCTMMDATTLRDASVTEAISGFRAVSILADDPSLPSVAPLVERCHVRGYPAYRLLIPDF